MSTEPLRVVAPEPASRVTPPLVPVEVVAPPWRARVPPVPVVVARPPWMVTLPPALAVPPAVWPVSVRVLPPAVAAPLKLMAAA
jgi:hypothetical protein